MNDVNERLAMDANGSPLNWFEYFSAKQTIWQFSETGQHAAYEMADLHSDFYFNSDAAVASPQIVNAVITKSFLPECLDRRMNPDLILSFVGQTSAGLIVAAHLSQRIGCDLVYVNIKTGELSAPLKKGARIIVVIDDLHSGGTAKALLRLVEANGAVPLAPVFCLANLSGMDNLLELEIFATFSHTPRVWPSATCQLCAGGSKALPARRAWRELLNGRST